MNESHQAKELLKQRESGVKLSNFIIQSWKVLAFRGILITASVYYCIMVKVEVFLVLAIGIFIGNTLQDFGWVSKISKSWPLTKKIINWEKVEEISKKANK